MSDQVVVELRLIEQIFRLNTTVENVMSLNVLLKY